MREDGDSRALGGRSIGRWAAEALTIVFSVLFALGVDQYRQSRAEQTLASRVRETIRAEVRDNRRLVQGALAHHDSLLPAMVAGTRLRLGATIPLPEWRARTGDRRALRELVAERLSDRGYPPPPGFVLRRLVSGEFALLASGAQTPIRAAGDSVQVMVSPGVQLKAAEIRNTAWETAQATSATIKMPVPVVVALADLYQAQRNYLTTSAATLQSLYNDSFTVSSLEDLRYFESQLLGRYARIDSLMAASPR